jgi:hypothetical protein
LNAKAYLTTSVNPSKNPVKISSLSGTSHAKEADLIVARLSSR